MTGARVILYAIDRDNGIKITVFRTNGTLYFLYDIGILLFAFEGYGNIKNEIRMRGAAHSAEIVNGYSFVNRRNHTHSNSFSHLFL